MLNVISWRNAFRISNPREKISGKRTIALARFVWGSRARLIVVAPEAAEAVVIGSDEAAQLEQPQMIATGGFEFAGGADAMEIAREPDLEQQTRLERRTALGSGRHGEVEGRQVHLLAQPARRPRP